MLLLFKQQCTNLGIDTNVPQGLQPFKSAFIGALAIAFADDLRNILPRKPFVINTP